MASAGSAGVVVQGTDTSVTSAGRSSSHSLVLDAYVVVVQESSAATEVSGTIGFLRHPAVGVVAVGGVRFPVPPPASGM